MFAPLQLPSDGAIKSIVDAVRTNPKDIGLGIVDTQSGQIYVSPASITPDHPSLVEQALQIWHSDDAAHLRGFTFGMVKRNWKFANNSSLNPDLNTMERELFEAIEKILKPKLESFS